VTLRKTLLISRFVELAGWMTAESHFDTDSALLLLPQIVGLNGLNFRVRVPALDKDINSTASKLVVQKNRVKLMLKKAGQFDYWTNLARKGGKKPAGEKPPADGGIMDMMRDLYNDGDDQMKKTIAEAWGKSRSEAARGGKGGFGGSSDFGAGLGGGAGFGEDDM
jgi:hypothetical protein